MMADSAPTLRDLQALDSRIEAAERRIGRFGPVLEKVAEPAILLEDESIRLRDRLRELRLEERRLELAAQDKRGRLSRLQDRLNQVRNLREEAAVHAESDMVRRASEADEQEALQLLDQIRRLEEQATDVEEALEEAKAAVEPRRQEILKEREGVESVLARMREEREECADRLDDHSRRIYESIRAGGRTVAVAALTEDGACGHCFSVVPLQLQNEIGSGAVLLRCEGCGVILTEPVPEGEEPEPLADLDELLAAEGIGTATAEGDGEPGEDAEGEEEDAEEDGDAAAEDEEEPAG